MFSVIIVSNNASASVLRRAIRSVQAQLYPPKEVIVVERGRSSASQEILSAQRPRSKQNLRHLYSPAPDAALARNLAVALAHGKFITFLEPEDELMPLALELYEQGFQQTSRADICYGRSITRLACGGFIASSSDSQPSGDVLRPLFKQSLAILPSAFAFRKEIFSKGLRFRSAPHCLECLDFLLRAADGRRFVSVQEDVAIVDQRASRLSPAARSARRGVLACHAQRLQDHLAPETVARTLSSCDYDAGRHWRLAGDYHRALLHFQRAAALDPRNSRYWLALAWVRSRLLLQAVGGRQ